MKFRHELKFYINYLDYLVIRQRLYTVFSLDQHVNGKGEYLVRSLYFDNINDKALREKIDGVNMREKFRIRCYNYDTSLIHLEKKSKINGLCNKQSLPITAEQTQKIIRGDTDWMRDSRDKLLIELYSKMKYQQLRPKTLVDYTREPFVYAPGNVRITIDHNIRTGILSTDIFNSLVPTVAAGEPVIILEIKYDNFLPQIVRDIIQLENRKSSAFSKYGACRIYG